MTGPLTAVEVTIRQVVDPDGHMSVRITTPASYNAVEILGLLAAAQFQVFTDMEGKG